MFSFTLFGKPIPQEQTRFFQLKGKMIPYNPNKRDIQKIKDKIIYFAPPAPFCGPVELSIWFFLAIPKSVKKKTQELMTRRLIRPDIIPDEDNLAYLITNSLKKIVYDDDKRICEKHVYKFYGEQEKTVIYVKPLACLQNKDYKNENPQFFVYL